MRSIILTGAGLVIAMGCSHHTPPASQGGGPPPVQVDIDAAVNRLASARCDREQRCGSIGNDKEYSSRENCMTVMRGREADTLELKNCPGGIDQKGLSECLDDVREDSCNNPIHAIGRHKECRSSEICYH
ncbi:MAG: DUF6184 family natural product biosynthesis lipoprotein [Polyangiales bacterium]